MRTKNGAIPRAEYRTEERGAEVAAVRQRGGMPHWDGVRSRLTILEVVVKEFQVPAANQRLILAAFQEEGWPLRMDDPLPRVGKKDPKWRLRHAVRRLNERQRERQWLRFHVTDCGTAVWWEWVDDAAPQGRG